MKTGIVFTCAAVLAASQFASTTLRAQDRKFNEKVIVQGVLRMGVLLGRLRRRRGLAMT